MICQIEVNMFMSESFLHPKVFLWKQRMLFLTILPLISLSNSKNFLLKFRKNLWKMKSFRSFFKTQKCSFGHVKCNFDNPAENFSFTPLSHGTLVQQGNRSLENLARQSVKYIHAKCLILLRVKPFCIYLLFGTQKFNRFLPGYKQKVNSTDSSSN